MSDPTVTLESTDQRCRIESSGGSFVLLGENPAVVHGDVTFRRPPDEQRPLERPAADFLTLTR